MDKTQSTKGIIVMYWKKGAPRETVDGGTAAPVAKDSIWQGRMMHCLPAMLCVMFCAAGLQAGVSSVVGNSASGAVDVFHGPDSRPLARFPQYWTPEGEDMWVGDVVMLTHKGRFHLFYLKDRHHHGLAEGMGCHCFAHLSATPELTDWMEHPDALPLGEWWQTYGTGTPFVKDGKLCLAYGLHTERVPDWEKLGLSAGATWAESEDGIHFKPSGVFFHKTRNPTVFNRADGLFGMAIGHKDASGNGVGGMFVSKDLLAWEPVDAGLPGKGDCPCYFKWNGHHYLLQGFTQFFHSNTGTPGSWEDWAETGEDLYDGLSVPMVCEIADGRRIISGWVRHPYGWGGWLAFRELRQDPDGRISMCWPVGAECPSKVFVRRFEADEKAVVVYRSVRGHKPMRLVVDPGKRMAEWASDRFPRNSHMYDLRNVAIRCVRGLDRPYVVKVIVWYDERHDATIFDAEVAGCRTLLTCRFGEYEPVEKE